MEQSTDHAQAAVLTHCCVCDVRLIGGTVVGLVETGSGPGRMLRACAPCVQRHRLIPLEEQEHPAGDGRLQIREG